MTDEAFANPDADLFDEPDGRVVRGFFRCETPSRYAAWLLADGTLIPMRCGATNRCPYCAYRRVQEDALLILLDAERRGPPRVGMTLTTVDPQHDMSRFRKDVEQVVRGVRRRLGDDVAYLGMMEWTTGRAARSGGKRRAHQHILLRNCHPSDAAAIEPDIRRVWSQRTGATRIEVRELRSPAGAVAYLIHHHRKREQAPPPDFKGRRLRYSKNYFDGLIAPHREEVATLLRSRRLRKAANRLIDWAYLDGAPDELIDEEWQDALAEARDQAARVTFVKLDHRGAILNYKPLSAQRRAQLRPGTPGGRATDDHPIGPFRDVA